MHYMDKIIFCSKKHSKVLFSWILSYLIVIISILVVSSLIYFISSSIIHRNINRVNQGYLEQMKLITDNQMKQVKQLTSRIALSSDLTTIMYEKSSKRLNIIYTKIQMIKDFKGYMATNACIEHFYVYFRNSNQIIDWETTAAPDIYYGIKEWEYFGDFDKWKKIITGGYNGRFIPYSHIKKDGAVLKSVVYIQSFPLAWNNEFLGNIVMIINKDNIMSVIEKMEQSSNRHVFVLDSNNDIVFGKKDFVLPHVLKYENLNDADPFSKMEINGEEYAVYKIKSNINSWKYIMAVPISSYMEQLNYVKKFTITVFLICLAVGICFAILFARKNYVPLNEIVNLIKKNGIFSASSDVFKNEYILVKNSIGKIISEKSNIAKKLENQKEIILNSFLIRLFKGRLLSSLKFEENLKYYNISLESNGFAVVIFQIISQNRFQNDSFTVLQISIKNIVNDIINCKFKAYTAIEDENIVSLINPQSRYKKDISSELFSICLDIQAAVSEHYNTDLVIAISSTYQNMCEISVAYSEAVSKVEEIALYGKSQIVKHDKTAIRSYNFYYPFNLQQQIINEVKMGNYHNASRIIDEIFEKNFNKMEITKKLAVCLIFNVAGTMIKIVNDIYGENEKDFTDNMNKINSMLSIGNIYKIKDNLTEMIKDTCRSINEKKTKHNTQLNNSIKNYINENFSDSSLNISMIASHFGMNGSYVARFFRTQNNCTINDYINEVRLKYSYNILKNSDLSIKKIAGKSGYSSIVTYIRIFKKNQGMTPGEYRKIYS